MRLLLALLFLPLFVCAQPKESKIRFRPELSWQQALDTAARLGRPVFVDVYTTWCGPCRRMEQEVFTSDEVGERFNRQFVTLRIDAEKGEGVQIARRYGVTGYPSLLFVDAKGGLLYNALGYRTASALLADADLALGEARDPKPYGRWLAEYDSAKTDRAWLRGFIEKQNKLRLDNDTVLERFYRQLKPAEYMRAENLLLVTKSRGIRLNGWLYKLLAAHFTEIDPKEDTAHHLGESLLGTFEGPLNGTLVPAIGDRNVKAIETQVVPAYALFPERIGLMPWYSKQTGDKWRFIYYVQTADAKGLVPVAKRYLGRYYLTTPVAEVRRQDRALNAAVKRKYAAEGVDTGSAMIRQYFSTYHTDDHLERLLSGAYVVLENTQDPALLAAALPWARRALALRVNAATVEAVARLEAALGRKTAALAVIDKHLPAIEDPAAKEKLKEVAGKIRAGR